MSIAADELLRVPLFQGMTDRALGALAELANPVAFATDDVITAEGDDGDAFYMLLAGRATVSRAGKDIRQLGPGDFFGEISLVDGRPRTATIRADSAIDALEIRRPDFQQLMDRFPAARLGIVMALADRVRADERDAV